MYPPILFFKKDNKIERIYNDHLFSFFHGKWYVRSAVGHMLFAIVIGIVCNFIIKWRPSLRSPTDQQKNNLNLDSTESTKCENTSNLRKHILSI